jgi:hypothetical protein
MAQQTANKIKIFENYKFFFITSIILFVSVFIYSVSSSSTTTLYGTWGLLILGILCLITGYIIQIIFIRKNFPIRSLLAQYLLLLGNIIVFSLVSAFADFNGYKNFNSGDQPGFGDLLIGIILGAIVGSVFIYVFAIGNYLYIKRGSYSHKLKNVSVVFYGFGCLITLVISFLFYSILYSLHDPSTE